MEFPACPGFRNISQFMHNLNYILLNSLKPSLNDSITSIFVHHIYFRSTLPSINPQKIYERTHHDIKYRRIHLCCYVRLIISFHRMKLCDFFLLCTYHYVHFMTCSYKNSIQYGFFDTTFDSVHSHINE